MITTLLLLGCIAVTTAGVNVLTDKGKLDSDNKVIFLLIGYIAGYLVLSTFSSVRFDDTLSIMENTRSDLISEYIHECKSSNNMSVIKDNIDDFNAELTVLHDDYMIFGLGRSPFRDLYIDYTLDDGDLFLNLA